MNAFGKPHLGHHQRGADLLDLFGSFDLAVGKKCALLHIQLYFELAQFARETRGEVIRHCPSLDALAVENEANDLGRRRSLPHLLFQVLLALTQRNDPAMRRLFASSVDLQIGHYDVAFAAQAQVDKWVRHEHPNRVQHVRVVFAVCHHQQVFASHAGALQREGRTLQKNFLLVHHSSFARPDARPLPPEWSPATVLNGPWRSWAPRETHEMTFAALSTFAVW